jgi:hypothetical protein
MNPPSTQLTFPAINSPSDAQEELKAIEDDAQAIASRYRNTLARVHAVGEFLAQKKQDHNSDNWTVFLQNNFPDFEISYLRKLIKFSKEHSREDVAALDLKEAGKDLQSVLSLPCGEEKEPTIPKPPNISTVANGMTRFIDSATSRYGGIDKVPKADQVQYKAVMKPILSKLFLIYSTEEILAMKGDSV